MISTKKSILPKHVQKREEKKPKKKKKKKTLLKTPMYNMFLTAEGVPPVGLTDQYPCDPNPLKQTFQMLIGGEGGAGSVRRILNATSVGEPFKPYSVVLAGFQLARGLWVMWRSVRSCCRTPISDSERKAYVKQSRRQPRPPKPIPWPVLFSGFPGSLCGVGPCSSP